MHIAQLKTLIAIISWTNAN